MWLERIFVSFNYIRILCIGRRFSLPPPHLCCLGCDACFPGQEKNGPGWMKVGSPPLLVPRACWEKKVGQKRQTVRVFVQATLEAKRGDCLPSGPDASLGDGRQMVDKHIRVQSVTCHGQAETGLGGHSLKVSSVPMWWGWDSGMPTCSESVRGPWLGRELVNVHRATVWFGSGAGWRIWQAPRGLYRASWQEAESPRESQSLNRALTSHRLPVLAVNTSRASSDQGHANKVHCCRSQRW